MNSQLRLPMRPGVHVLVDLSYVAHPLFGRCGKAPGWRFGLSLTPSALLFHFRVPHPVIDPGREAGIDLNFHSADIAASDGRTLEVDLRPITRLQESMVRRRQSIQRQISKDLRHRRAVLRRHHGRER